MILKGNVTIGNKLDGSLDEEELVGFIRQTVNIPTDALVDFYIRTTQGERIDILRVNFEATWEVTQRGEEQVLPAKVVTTVPPAPPKADAEQG